MKRVPAPPRLVELPAEHELGRLGALVESVPQVPSTELSLVKWRVRSTLRRRVEWRRRALRVAVVGTLLFLAGGVVGAMVQPVLLSKLRASLATSAEPTRPAHAASNVRGRRRAEPPGPVEPPASVPMATELEAAKPGLLTPPAPEPGIAGVSSAPATRASTHGKPSVSVPVKLTIAASTPVVRGVQPSSPRELPARAASEAPPSSPASYLLSPPPPSAPAFPTPATQQHPSEQALLAKALRSLSIDHDPKRALATLDEHGSRFPFGALVPEAARLRAWALLLSGHGDAALAELSRQPSGTGAEGLPGDEEYRVLRGELHAKAGRWREALSEFDAAVAACFAMENAGGLIDKTTLSRLERALWGRASARSHLGDRAGAVTDLREYLRRFPQGRFAVPAARLSKGGG